MNTTTKKQKVTLMLETQVYEALVAKVGARGISEYFNNLARPRMVDSDLEAGYKAMAADEAANREAKEWLDGITEPVITDDKNEETWQF